MTGRPLHFRNVFHTVENWCYHIAGPVAIVATLGAVTTCEIDYASLRAERDPHDPGGFVL